MSDNLGVSAPSARAAAGLRPPEPARMRQLDQAIRRALLTGERSGFDLVGAGEITCVVGFDGCACKRLPPVGDASRLAAYGALLERYVGELGALGVPVVDTAWRMVSEGDQHVGYIVQRLVPADTLLPGVLRRGTVAQAVAVLEVVLDHVDRCVDAGVGIDPQLSNWSIEDGAPLLLDVTTPMLRDEAGRDLLDTEIFVAMLPVLVRWIVRRFLVADILDKNFERRGALLDLIGNIENYGLKHLTEAFLPVVNARLEAPLTLAEIARYRRTERVTWTILRRALWLEQLVQRRVLRTATLHLLPSEFGRA